MTQRNHAVRVLGSVGLVAIAGALLATQALARPTTKTATTETSTTTRAKFSGTRVLQGRTDARSQPTTTSRASSSISVDRGATVVGGRVAVPRGEVQASPYLLTPARSQTSSEDFLVYSVAFNDWFRDWVAIRKGDALTLRADFGATQKIQLRCQLETFGNDITMKIEHPLKSLTMTKPVKKDGYLEVFLIGGGEIKLSNTTQNFGWKSCDVAKL